MGDRILLLHEEEEEKGRDDHQDSGDREREDILRRPASGKVDGHIHQAGQADRSHDRGDPAHRIDHAVCFTSQIRRNHVGHQRDDRSPNRLLEEVENEEQDDQEPEAGKGAERNQAERHRADRQTDDDKRHPSPDRGVHPVAESTENRNQKDRQNVVERHDRSDERLGFHEAGKKDGNIGIIEGIHQPHREKPESDQKRREVISLQTLLLFGHNALLIAPIVSWIGKCRRPVTPRPKRFFQVHHRHESRRFYNIPVRLGFKAHVKRRRKRL